MLNSEWRGEERCHACGDFVIGSFGETVDWAEDCRCEDSDESPEEHKERDEDVGSGEVDLEKFC